MALCRTLLVCLALFAAIIVVINSHSDVHEHTTWKLLSKLAWKNATVRPPLLIIAMVAGWGWVVSVCEKAGLDLERVLSGQPQAPRDTYHAALVLLAVLLTMRLMHLVASEQAGVVWRPWLTSNVLLHVVFLVLTVLPCNVFFANSRFSLLRVLWESFIAPFAPVTFWHVIVADYMTSLAKAFSDLQLTACVSYHIFNDRPEAGYVRSTELWHESYMTCADTTWNALFLALPFWWRLMQCLKVYSVTGEIKNLCNAAKYSTAFPLVYAGYLRRHSPSPFYDHLFILAAITQSTFCLIWDVHMDWGLFRPQGNGFACCGAKPVNLFRLRDPLLITQNRAVYIGICVFDLALRFIWALSIFGGVPGRGLGMFFFEIVELLRRTVWAIFRIEWEVGPSPPPP